MCLTSQVCPCENSHPIPKPKMITKQSSMPPPSMSPMSMPPSTSYSAIANTQNTYVESEGSLVSELIQSELSLWTFSISAVLTYIWTSRQQYFLFNLFFLIPCALVVTLMLSWALIICVTFGRLIFGRPLTLSNSPLTAQQHPGKQDQSEWILQKLPILSTYTKNRFRSNKIQTIRDDRKGHRSHSVIELVDKSTNMSSAAGGKSSGVYVWSRRPSIDRKTSIRSIKFRRS